MYSVVSVFPIFSESFLPQYQSFPVSFLLFNSSSHWTFLFLFACFLHNPASLPLSLLPFLPSILPSSFPFLIFIPSFFSLMYSVSYLPFFIFLLTFWIYRIFYVTFKNNKVERHIKYLWELKHKIILWSPKDIQLVLYICYVYNKYLILSLLIVKEEKLFYKTHSFCNVK